MRAKAGIIILLGLLLIIGTVSADMADSGSTITSDKTWVVARPMDTTTVTVMVKNSTPGLHAVPGATVTFTIDNNVDIQGSMSPITVIADASGKATSTFVTGKRSGVAVIKATIVSDDNGIPHTNTITMNQNVDHYLAQSASFNTPEELTVGTVDTLTVTVRDVWGNPIDNKNGAEIHTFALHMPGNEGRGLWNGSGYGPVTQLTTDAFGNATTGYRVAELAGYDVNYIYMDTFGNMVTPQSAFIDGLAEEEPWFISQTYPSPSSLPADGVSIFEVYFGVYDKYMNPINGTPILLTTSDGFSATRTSNPDGLAYMKFGPKDLIGHYTLSGGPTANLSAVCRDTGELANCSQVVEYYNTDPVDLMVMANPQGMASLDVSPSASGLVQARVVDTKGNPVTGETVTFSLGTPVYSDLCVPASGPTLSATTATVASGGFATVTFTPGSFVGSTNPSYNSTATGQVVVTASWTNTSGFTITRPVTFVWKNYPYLGISVPAEACKDVAVGDTINITVKLTGDGAALKPKPINAVLVMDVSGSMGTSMNGPAGWRTRLFYSNMSGNAFVDQMDSAQDQVGLVTYSKSSSLKQTLTTDFPSVRTALKAMATDATTNERMGTYTGIKDMVTHNPDTSKTINAIIVMTDGEYNYDGDMLARGTAYGTEQSLSGTNWYAIPDAAISSPTRFTDPKQNMSAWAIAHKYRIYTVTFGTGLAAFELATNEKMAELTGGHHYHANTGDEALAIYEKIAGELKEVAGGNTQVALNFNTVKVNDIMGGGDVRYYMKYVSSETPSSDGGPLPSDSTYLNKTHWFTSNSTMSYYSGYPIVQDDTVAWDNRLMEFTPGDIKLDDTWSANFRLKLNASGKIELFGPGTASEICFTDASTEKTTCQFIPAFQCNIQESLINEGIGDEYLFIGNLTADNTKEDPNILKIQYNVTYTGKDPMNTVTETIWYKPPGGQYKLLDGGVDYDSNCFEKTHLKLTDTTTWAVGLYSIQVRGKAPDSNGATITTTWEKKGPSDINYIKLE
jgi:hypothetical protein